MTQGSRFDIGSLHDYDEATPSAQILAISVAWEPVKFMTVVLGKFGVAWRAVDQG